MKKIKNIFTALFTLVLTILFANNVSAATVDEVIEKFNSDSDFTTIKDDAGKVIYENEVSYDDDTITFTTTNYLYDYYGVYFSVEDNIISYEIDEIETYEEAEQAESQAMFADVILSTALKANGYTTQEIQKFMEKNEFDYEINGIEIKELGESKEFENDNDKIEATPVSFKIDVKKANLNTSSTDSLPEGRATVEDIVKELEKLAQNFEGTVNYEDDYIDISWSIISDSETTETQFSHNGNVIEYSSKGIKSYEEAVDSMSHSIYIMQILQTVLELNGYSNEEIRAFLISDEVSADYETNGIEIKQLGESQKFTSEDGTSQLTITPVSIKIDVEKANLDKKTIKYEVLEGAKQSIDISKTSDLTFRFNIEYAKFKENGKVYIDGELVESSNYTSKEGSTIITFNSDYVKKLSAKEHTLKVAVADGEVETTFTIAKTTNNPATGDNMFTYISILVVSIIGFVGATLFTKKKRFN